MNKSTYSLFRDSELILSDSTTLNLKDPSVDLSRESVWIRILGHKQFSQLSKEGVSVVIPFHNSDHLSNTVESIFSSILPKRVSITLTIVCSNCKDKYIENARNIKQKYLKHSINIIFDHVGGKPRAINTFLQSTTSSICYQFCDDILISKNTLPLMVLAMCKWRDYGACVAHGIPQTAKGTSQLLSEVQKIFFDKFTTNQEYSLVGRAIAFRRSVIGSGFPEDIMSEDYWLQIQANKKSMGYLTISNACLRYYNPSTWSDFFKQQKRFYDSFRQLQDSDPTQFSKYFGIIKPSAGFMFTDGTITPHKSSFVEILRFIGEKRYSFVAKLIYLLVVFNQIYLLPYRYSKNPLKGSVFSREKSTLIG